jgi:hypothetical protein
MCRGRDKLPVTQMIQNNDQARFQASQHCVELCCLHCNFILRAKVRILVRRDTSASGADGPAGLLGAWVSCSRRFGRFCRIHIQGLLNRLPGGKADAILLNVGSQSASIVAVMLCH